MNYPKGRGWYIWNIKDPDLFDGDVNRIAQQAQATEVNWVAIKVADGINPHGEDALIVALIQALRKVGIDVYGWQYIYLTNFPWAEANMGVKRFKQFDLTGFILDPEAEAEQAGETKTRTYTRALREGLGPLVPIGLSSWRFPSGHPGMNWNIWVEISDFHCPQVYWALANNAGEQLRKSYTELMAKKKMPFVPAGALFRQAFPTKEGPVTWQPTREQVLDFVRVMQELGITASLWWEWANARRYGMESWFKDVPKEAVVVPVPVVTLPAPYQTTKWFVWCYPDLLAPRATKVIMFPKTRVTVLAICGNKAQLKDWGWVYLDTLQPVEVIPPPLPQPLGNYQVIKAPLWVLSGPGYNYKAVTSLKLGQVVSVQKIQGEFGQIPLGWVALAALKKV